MSELKWSNPELNLHFAKFAREAYGVKLYDAYKQDRQAYKQKLEEEKNRVKLFPYPERIITSEQIETMYGVMLALVDEAIRAELDLLPVDWYEASQRTYPVSVGRLNTESGLYLPVSSTYIGELRVQNDSFGEVVSVEQGFTEEQLMLVGSMVAFMETYCLSPAPQDIA
jgi:hypothetical protein